jgi:hypothetical protein
MQYVIQYNSLNNDLVKFISERSGLPSCGEHRQCMLALHAQPRNKLPKPRLGQD